MFVTKSIVGAIAMAALLEGCSADHGGGATDGGITDASSGSGGQPSSGGSGHGGMISQESGGVGALPSMGGASAGGKSPSAGGSHDGGDVPATGGSHDGGSVPVASSDGGIVDGGGVVDSGTHDVPDASDSGGAADASDGATAHAPPCPIGATFPAGTYEIQSAVYEDLTYAGTIPSSVVDDCSSSPGVSTITITEDKYFAGQYNVQLSGAGTPSFAEEASFNYVNVVDIDSSTININSTCTSGFCPPDQGSISFDIDRRTGIVTNLAFSVSHVGIYPSTDTVLLNGTGWPVCAASTASPPTWVPAPDPVRGCVANNPTCSSSRTYLDGTISPAPAPPECPSNDACQCTNETAGFTEICCPP